MFFFTLASVVAVVAAQCSFDSGDVSARWQVHNGMVTVEFKNKNLGNNQWTGMGFGDSMDDLEVVLFTVQNNKASIRTGFTKGYGPPTLDSSANVEAELVNLNSNQLTARFTRPVGRNGARGNNLSQCSTWNFVSSSALNGGQIGVHSSRPTALRVCPEQCTSNLVTRDVDTDPIPQQAVYNNRQSSRFNGLHGNN